MLISKFYTNKSHETHQNIYALLKLVSPTASLLILLCDQVLAHLWKTDLILVFGEACSKQQKDSHLMGRAKYVCMRVDTEVVKSPISWLNTIYHNTHTHTFYLQPVFGIPTSTQQKTKRTKIFTRREGQPSHSSQSSKVSSCYKYLSFHHCKNHEGHPGRQRSGLDLEGVASGQGSVIT